MKIKLYANGFTDDYMIEHEQSSEMWSNINVNQDSKS